MDTSTYRELVAALPVESLIDDAFQVAPETNRSVMAASSEGFSGLKGVSSAINKLNILL
ncbi:hypothetical protein CCACVL1_02294 [Corchorus capsularis]|uniref:Uncharacterized protein n=1 Tax=Corchorus capsularis TaxID=210143 RepID=A0A1R3K9J8_COCAP|nr:hypothetical protein CCACVL1_02294 [Corchorus capsularis]